MNSLVLWLGLLLTSSVALASGFEKAIPWGGETSGVAGIGTPYIQGSQSLYFNPAGLVSDKAGAQDITLNISPTIPTFKAPIDDNDDIATSKSQVLIPFSLMYGKTINDRWGFGVGYYISGGSDADFPNVSIPPYAGPFESKVDLTTSELAAGVGYKIMDGLKVGASYRVTMVQAALDVVEHTGGALAEVQIQNAKDTEYTAFKLGAQYQVNDKMDIGLTYRSPVGLKASGTMSTSVYAPALVPSMSSSSSVTVNSVLPAAVNLGATYAITDEWKVLAEYVWTQYSQVSNLAINPSGAAGTPLQLQWSDENQVKLAGEYKGWSMPLRFGFIYTSQVTNATYMLAGLTPPSAAQTLTLGTGRAFNLGNQTFRADGGLEYTWMSGSANGGQPGDNTNTIRAGTYALSLYAVHLGLTYMF